MNQIKTLIKGNLKNINNCRHNQPNTQSTTNIEIYMRSESIIEKHTWSTNIIEYKWSTPIMEHKWSTPIIEEHTWSTPIIEPNSHQNQKS